MGDGQENRGWASTAAFGGGPLQQGETAEQATARNRAALAAGLAWIDSRGGGIVFVPAEAGYGYKVTAPATYPQFGGIASDVIVFDASAGASYTPPSKDGAQLRCFFHTGGAETLGQHDGNTLVLDGLWHPNVVITNHLPRPTDADTTALGGYNKRASLNFGSNGVPVWQIGQGLAPRWAERYDPAGWEDDVNSFGIAWAPGNGGTNILSIFREVTSPDQYRFLIGWNTIRPESEFHVVARSPHHDGHFIFQSLGGNADIELRTTSGGRRLSLRRDNQEIGFTNSTQDSNVFVVDDRGSGSFAAGVTGSAFRSDQRPSGCPVGTMVFDTDLGKPVWLKATGNWVDAAGNSV